MNTTEIIKAVASESGFSQVDTKKTVLALFKALATAMKNKEEIRISGFGTFYSRKREASTGRNPQTGKPIAIKAALQAKFRPAKELKEVINS
jgi:DNA-binding protein HU-beta